MGKKTPERQMIRATTRVCAVHLDDSEALEKADQLAQVVDDIATETARQTDVKQQLKSKLTELESRHSQLASIVRRREEYRDVEVELYLTAAGMVEVVRTDTGEVVDTRKATETEMQADLELE